MTNYLTTNPIIINDVGATSAIAYKVRIKSIVWDSGDSGAAADNLIIHDKASGNIIFSATLNANNQTIIFCPSEPVWVDGIYVTTMTHGVLLIYS